jgi:hypothetical protein
MGSSEQWAKEAPIIVPPVELRRFIAGNATGACLPIEQTKIRVRRPSAGEDARSTAARFLQAGRAGQGRVR